MPGTTQARWFQPRIEAALMEGPVEAARLKFKPNLHVKGVQDPLPFKKVLGELRRIPVIPRINYYWVCMNLAHMANPVSARVTSPPSHCCSSFMFGGITTIRGAIIGRLLN